MTDPLNELRRLGFDPDAAGIRRTQELLSEMEDGATAEQALDNLPMYGGALADGTGRRMTPAEARKAWTTALRSGEFAQGRGHLGDATLGYCCLGVACKLAMDAGVIDGYNVADPNLPTEVCNWLGLSDVEGHYVDNYDAFTYNLAEVNDSGTSFERIAAIIEAEPDELLAGGVLLHWDADGSPGEVEG